MHLFFVYLISKKFLKLNVMHLMLSLVMFLAKRSNILFFIMRSSMNHRGNIQFMTVSFMPLFTL
jgi:hypothetical protein